MAENILVIRNDALGDLVLSCPLLKNCKDLWPQSRLTVLTRAYTSPLLNYHKSVDEVIIDFKSNHKRPWFMNFIDTVRFFKKKNYDMILFPLMDPFYVWAAFFAGITVRVGDKNQLLLNPLLTERVNVSWRDISKHEVQQQLRLLSPFTEANLDDDQFNLQISQDELNPLKDKFVEYASKKWVVVHASYGAGNRGWPAQFYAELIDKLSNEETTVFLTGAGSDKDITDVIVKLCKNKPVDLTNKTSLDDLVILIKEASLVIGAETGPLHLASAFKVPVLSISPTKFVQSFRWGPWKTSHVVLKNNKQCPLICHTYKRPCESTYCLEKISVTDVHQAAQFLLTGQAFPSSPLHYWFVTNAKVALHVDFLDEKQESIALYKQLHEAGISVFFTTTSKDVFNTLKEHELQVLYQSKWNVFFWVKWLAIQNVSIWQVINTTSSTLYFKSVATLAGLRINLAPLVIMKGNSQASLKLRIDAYLEHFKAFSDDSL